MTDTPPPPTRSGYAPEGSAFFDVRVCYPNAESYKGLTTKQIYRPHESEKTRMHASGGSRGGARGAPGPPLFFDQNEARRAEKNFLETAPPPLISGSG